MILIFSFREYFTYAVLFALIDLWDHHRRDKLVLLLYNTHTIEINYSKYDKDHQLSFDVSPRLYPCIFITES